ncbi:MULTISPECIES: hypothetical protein [Clostridium]|uniref:hypothetical protein n=1 Tax=Clostridium TaxID=1485 RepID=UPI000DFEB228|nr:hypothetical protein [Clostridium sporogenes]MCW6085500.1 hypothetical protein [Clostridium sporogenes]STC83934.1 Uncharacterised protein [Clostridium botulinum]
MPSVNQGIFRKLKGSAKKVRDEYKCFCKNYYLNYVNESNSFIGDTEDLASCLYECNSIYESISHIHQELKINLKTIDLKTKKIDKEYIDSLKYLEDALYDLRDKFNSMLNLVQYSGMSHEERNQITQYTLYNY